MPPVNPILGPSETAESSTLLKSEGVSTVVAVFQESKRDPVLKKEVKKVETKISFFIPAERHSETIQDNQRKTPNSPLTSSPQALLEQHIPGVHPEITIHFSQSDELPPPLVTGAVAVGEVVLVSGGVAPSVEESRTQTVKILSEKTVVSNLFSSLGFLLNNSFFTSGEVLLSLLQTFTNSNLQFQAPAQGLASAETLLQQAPLQAKAGDFPPSTIKGFVESVAHQVSLALSMTVSHGAQLNPAQALTLALAKSLNLSAEQTAKLLGQIQSASSGQLSAATGEQARLVNPFIQGMVLNDPSAMKGFMAQLFSPVLKSLMGLLFTKELPFSYFPSNLLTELGGLMARSAQRKRNRPQRKRVGKSDRVSRKGSIYVEVDLEDEGFEPEEETDWWERFYHPEEAHAFLWN